MPARPFLKWAGGKGQLLPELTSRLPTRFCHYHEPFLGGGALFFNLSAAGRLAYGATLSDSNAELVDCYKAVRNHVEELIAALLAHEPHFNDKHYFYEVRAWDRQPGFLQRSLVARAARTIFLNRTCYNGLYRLNNKRQFNVPFGNYKKPLIVDPDNMREASRVLQTVDLRVEDFARVAERARAGDFIYFDPPYVPVSATASFTAYTHQGFFEADQVRLAHVFSQLAERDCYVMLSNSYTARARELYQGQPIHESIMASRKINCDGQKRGVIEELLVCSYGLQSEVDLQV
ncbi:MAG: DNA adenine methylase [Candidatus Viridilinea halotolerans]|uniref:Site-specific DNA-methyltransferase (adenine-specific) n=1 Tax=Candidatus Viridilinea halotolerans TaxID=2491704 RepID=A0A426UBH7_9CHLR|nr:MAG: DNA adenine methylase [Candidatus Viridilinea halotolerans]